MELFEIMHQEEGLKNTYQVVIDFMHGDADGYSQETFESDNELLVYVLVELLDKIQDKNCRPETNESEIIEMLTNYHLSLVMDCTSGYDFYASIEQVSVFLYDEHGNKFELNPIEKEKKEEQKDMITIPKSEYNRLVKVDCFMDSLQAAGIDNAMAYEYGQELFREYHPEYFDKNGEEKDEI